MSGPKFFLTDLKDLQVIANAFCQAQLLGLKGTYLFTLDQVGMGIFSPLINDIISKLHFVFTHAVFV